MHAYSGLINIHEVQELCDWLQRVRLGIGCFMQTSELPNNAGPLCWSWCWLVMPEPNQADISRDFAGHRAPAPGLSFLQLACTGPTGQPASTLGGPLPGLRCFGRRQTDLGPSAMLAGVVNEFGVYRAVHINLLLMRWVVDYLYLMSYVRALNFVCSCDNNRNSLVRNVCYYGFGSGPTHSPLFL